MTVDAAIIAKPAEGKPAKLLLIQRKKPPCQVQPGVPIAYLTQCAGGVCQRAAHFAAGMDIALYAQCRDNGPFLEGSWMRMSLWIMQQHEN